MSRTAIISSSPSTRARMEVITEAVRTQLIERDHQVQVLRLRDLPRSALMVGNQDHPEILWSQRFLVRTQGIVLVMPTYEISGSTLLRAWVELAPHGAFDGKTVQPVGLGAFRSHATGIDSTLAAQLGPKARLLRACFLMERSIGNADGTWCLDANATKHVSRATAALSAELDRAEAVRLAS